MSLEFIQTCKPNYRLIHFYYALNQFDQSKNSRHTWFTYFPDLPRESNHFCICCGDPSYFIDSRLVALVQKTDEDSITCEMWTIPYHFMEQIGGGDYFCYKLVTDTNELKKKLEISHSTKSFFDNIPSNEPEEYDDEIQAVFYYEQTNHWSQNQKEEEEEENCKNKKFYV